MTCIAGVIERETGLVYLCGDSAGVAGYDLTVRADPKVFKVGEFIFGMSGSFRMGDLLHHTFKPPVPKPGEPIERFMASRFIDSLRKCFKKGGFAKTKNDEETIGGSFLVGFRGRLFEIDADYQVGEAVASYNAVGCGAEIAKGALFVTEKAPPMDRLKGALEAAERHSGGVRAPFRYVQTDPLAPAPVKAKLKKALPSKPKAG